MMIKTNATLGMRKSISSHAGSAPNVQKNIERMLKNTLKGVVIEFMTHEKKPPEV